MLLLYHYILAFMKSKAKNQCTPAAARSHEQNLDQAGYSQKESTWPHTRLNECFLVVLLVVTKTRRVLGRVQFDDFFLGTVFDPVLFI
jgi:hypothetical protein